MNREYDFLDVLTIASFLISLQNLDLNASTDDLSKYTNEIIERLEKDLDDIHGHLSVQDAKINALLNRLEDLYGSTGDF